MIPVFLSRFEEGHFSMEEITDDYIYHKDKNAECFFIGEMLSDTEETYLAFQQFIRTLNPEQLLFLRGNYQTIVRISDKLWLFSDLGNVRPIYYLEHNKQWLLSSHLSILNKKVQSPYNLSWLRRSLSTSGFHIELESPFKKIKTVPGGYALHIHDHTIQIFQAWNIDKDSKLSGDTAKELLKEELTASVLLRCQNKKITTDLSGGLDSSTLTWIASREHSVKSVTIIGKEENEDSKIAIAISREEKNIEQVLLNQDEIPSIYSSMDKIQTDIPIPFLWSANKVRKKIDWAKENQSDIHFSGEGGDTVLGADFTYLVDLIHQGKWKTFVSHARDWAETKKQSPWIWIKGSLLLALHLSFQPKQRHPLTPTNNQADWFHFSPLVKKGRYSKFQGISNTVHGIYYLGYISHGLKNLAEQEQVRISFPYLDHNVIRTCIRTPSEKKMNPHVLKPILKQAFQNNLPTPLLERNTKGDYTSDVYYGMKRNFSWFQENFQEMLLADMGLVDIHKFRECFQRLLMGVPVKLPEFHQTLALEMWLRQFD
jgi:asparagine synthase (glutamine-hydrolysing)